MDFWPKAESFPGALDITGPDAWGDARGVASGLALGEGLSAVGEGLSLAAVVPPVVFISICLAQVLINGLGSGRSKGFPATVRNDIS